MSTASPPAPYAAPATTQDDGGVMHFIRFVLIGAAMSLLSIVLVGAIWQIISLSKVGYRKRDVLLFLVPVLGWIIAVKCLWRYTAKDVYWTPRDDRPSSSLFSGS